MCGLVKLSSRWLLSCLIFLTWSPSPLLELLLFSPPPPGLQRKDDPPLMLLMQMILCSSTTTATPLLLFRSLSVSIAAYSNHAANLAPLRYVHVYVYLYLCISICVYVSRVFDFVCMCMFIAVDYFIWILASFFQIKEESLKVKVAELTECRETLKTVSTFNFCILNFVQGCIFLLITLRKQ